MCENKMVDPSLFGRLAHARRARPRRFRFFNAHLDQYEARTTSSQDSVLVETA